MKSEPIPRAEGVSDRAVVLGLGGRFADELLGGLPSVLRPTIRTQLGLSLQQVALLDLTLDYVGATIEPVNGLLIDVWERRWLLAWGAMGLGLAIITMGVAPTFAVLLLGYAIYGLASGPLAHTADVVLVEAHPSAPGRIFARATIVDTMGALLAPLLVTLAVWLRVEWRWLLVIGGLAGLVYGVVLMRTGFPAPAGQKAGTSESFWQQMRTNIRLVVTNRQALLWLLFLLAFDLLEVSFPFKTIWLNEQVGMSQALIGLYVALEMGVQLVSLAVLDRWLARTHFKRVLAMATVGLLVLFPAWVLVPGVWARFVLAVPLNFLLAVFWPIGKGQSLGSVPGRAGTVTAVRALFGFLPLTLLFSLLAERIELTTAMLWVGVGALLILSIVVSRIPSLGTTSH